MSKKFLFYFKENCNLKELKKEVTLANSDNLIILDKNNLKFMLSDNISPIVFLEFGSDYQEDENLALEIKNTNPKAKIITSTSSETREHLLSFIRLKIEAYLPAPLSLMQLQNFVKDKKKNTPSKSNNLFSKNKEINKIMKTIEQVGNKPINCFFTGESGVGKEFFAKYFLKQVKKSDIPFVTVNCPAIPENLFESELFGHEKGSFTGAIEQKKGKIELAQGGILFLDEIGDMPIQTQTKLLRVIQEKEIERVGGTKKIPINFILLSASSKNLHEEIKANHFRPDLYYRIADIEIKVPPLRDRLEDLENLINFFTNEYTKEHDEKEVTYTPEAIELLKCYDWPGNIRELKSIIKKLCIFKKDDVIKEDDIKNQIPKLENIHLIKFKSSKSEDISNIDSGNLKKLDIKESEKDLISKAIVESNGNLSQAARKVGLSRSTLYRKIKKYNIKISA